ncbi:S8 family serine peptidase [Pontibacter sp. JH31]|uniref:S8 family serine peptidase n=1 Tax=Pontibacter aquaedesilientis TaxID=2766980 RepID=A0ABR7XL35_9BACT|nr:S8 family serine peptidase [Pontibacter aquaedesilientis]MBD1398985.1 S8 family serine peptidase [Pontibacter aquaedesilientis]
MRNRMLSMAAVILCMTAAPVLAQKPNAKGQEQATNKAALQSIHNEIAPKAKSNKEHALQLARQKNWVVRHVEENGTVISLEGVDERGFPIHYITENNTRAAASVKTDQVWPGGGTGLNLSGSSDALRGKLGVWDGGAVRLSHQELLGRVTQRDGATAISDHAVHVSGTMIASGVNPLAKGMSFGARNLQAWDFSNDTPEMAAAAHELLISNHSYGTIAGWYYNTGRAGTATNPFWEFRANPNVSTTEDYNFGYYNSAAQLWDQIAYNAPYYLMVKSAGNNRNQTGPAVGQPYWKLNSTGAWVLEAQRQAGISSNNGYDIIATYGNAKNILTVGAVEPIANGYKTAADVKISSFSSWGPTDDGRIKPDIVGNGVGLLSSVGTADDAYSSMNGTSMSAPNVSGSLNLLQEHYHNKSGEFMRAATLKGLAIHTADEAGTTPGPDYVYGWGLLNIEKAARMISNSGNNLINERTLAQGETYTFNVTASGAGPLMVTISWTDVEGQVISVGPSALNNRSPRLVNDLDVRVSKGLTTYMPWVMDPANPALAASFGDNFRDNVEQVYIANAVPGENYTITIRHKGTLVNGPQAYSLLVSGIGGSAYCASSALSNADSKITQFTLGALSNTPAAGCSASADYTNLTANLEIGQTVPLSLTLGTCGADNNKVGKVYIDWNNDGDFEDEGELVATTGVVNNTQTYTSTVTVPTSVQEGNISRMRVVLVETTNPNDVSACGTYGKGETHDYRVRFLAASKDVGITAVMFPLQGFCANPAQNVEVVIRNFGTAAQSNIPVTVGISNSNGQVATLTGTYTATISSNSEARFFLPGTFNAAANTSYTFTAATALTNDQNAGNNRLVQVLSTSSPTDAPVASATVCGSGPTVLRASGNGTVFWYDAMTGGNLVTIGKEATLENATVNKTYYAALNDFSGTVPAASPTSGGAMSSFTNGRMYFDAEIPFILDKATINVGTGGTMTVDLLDKDLSGNVIASTVITVVPGVNEYILNLPIPTAGKNYTLMVSAFGGGATAYRNNTTNAAAYPFTIPNVVSFTGNNASTPTAFYYFLYNMKVKATGCASPRVAVTTTAAPATVAAITPAGPAEFCVGGSVVLNANTGSGLSYTWRKDGKMIENATAATYEATASGNYTVTVTAANGCPQTSQAVAVTVNPLPPTAVSISKNFGFGICPGQDFTLELRAETGGQSEGYTYQWTRNGAPIANAAGATYMASTSGNYTVSVTTPCGTTTATPVAVNNDVATVTAPAGEICGTSGSANLAAQTNAGKLYWFDAATEGTLLHIGETFATPVLTQNTTYYVAASNETVGNLGSKNHSVNGGHTSFTGGRMYFDAQVPFVLQKSTINVATAGTMTVVLLDKDLSNTVIASTTINVVPGVREYDLNLLVPAAGKNYGIQVSAFGGGATAYRNNTTNSAVYPYTLPGIASITGNNQTAPSSFYYFLYDWQVSAASCSTAPRVSVPVTLTPATVAGTLSTSAESVCYGSNGGTITLSGQTGSLVRWEASTAGASWTTVEGSATTLQFLNLTQTTSYRALVRNGGCSEVYTAAVTVTVNALPVAAISVSEANKFGFVTLTASPAGQGNKYLWSNGETKASISVRPGNHTYTVTVTDGNGCSATSAPAKAIPMPNAHSVHYALAGEQEMQDGLSLKAYPNPSAGRFTISFTAEETGKVSVRLVNAVGQVMLEDTQNSFSGHYEQQVNMANAPKGVYILQVSLQNRTITRKVVIQH